MSAWLHERRRKIAAVIHARRQLDERFAVSALGYQMRADHPWYPVNQAAPPGQFKSTEGTRRELIDHVDSTG